MVFIQYFHYAVPGPWNDHAKNELIETCGDRGVVILDGRTSLATMHHDARNFNSDVLRQYPAYQLFKGETLTRSHSISEVIKL